MTVDRKSKQTFLGQSIFSICLTGRIEARLSPNLGQKNFSSNYQNKIIFLKKYIKIFLYLGSQMTWSKHCENYNRQYQMHIKH